MVVKVEIYALTIAIFLVIFYSMHAKNNDVKEGLNSCIENVQDKCGPVIEYASLLEAENSKLNKQIRECRAKN